MKYRVIRFDEYSGELPDGVCRAPGDGIGGAYVETRFGRKSIRNGDFILHSPDGVELRTAKSLPARFTMETTEEPR